MFIYLKLKNFKVQQTNAIKKIILLIRNYLQLFWKLIKVFKRKPFRKYLEIFKNFFFLQ